ncbi:hypothetical protein BD410DRAFT_819051 [Rickenella mellea]|uniref:Uncharacterized protein n=1 Tax=Rickenella mellea TaxID=50990 RepID=A0A4Y7QHX0_9AGAM|nr:hypothetical protein BD410DRAFT_819051 [Rickenella mellea]
MLSSLSSFVSTNLNFVNSKDDAKEKDTEVRTEVVPPQTEEVQADSLRRAETVVDEQGVKKKKEKSANETFIVVRPPPSVSNHPLNLQLQMVPPQTKDKSMNRRSVDFSNPGEGLAEFSQGDVPLTRQTSGRSNRSDVSMYSNVSSMTSVSSLGSTNTTASGRRMIIPLYNLSAHNVMTNTVLDAGTDAKVAKFLKRKLEMCGLVELEAHEVWGPKTDDFHRVPTRDGETTPSASQFSHNVHDSPQTPTSSALSLSSAGDHHSQSKATPTPRNPLPGQPPNGAKKIFGKLFKKKEGSGSQSPTMSITPIPETPTPSSKRLSIPSSIIPPSSPSRRAASESNQGLILQPAVLGIQPILISANNPPIGRPTKYVWVATKWLKGSESVLVGMMSKLNSDRSVVREPGAEVEVRFEWIRGKSHHRRGGTNATSQGNGKRASLLINKSNTPSQSSLNDHARTHTPSGSKREEKRTTTASPPGGRRSLESHRSQSPRPESTTNASQTSASDEGTDKLMRTRSRARTDGDDDGEVSDPEDSETPWSCTISLTPISNPRPQQHMLLNLPSRAHARQPSAPELSTHASPSPLGHPPLRLKVASLSPAPHHPKVVAQLKVPFPLPDIEVDNMRVRKRVVTASGIARPAPATTKDGRSEGLVLSAEEIKDVLSTTAMWLVVREGFGGVGKVNRKGDGWRIRG